MARYIEDTETEERMATQGIKTAAIRNIVPAVAAVLIAALLIAIVTIMQQ
jgi:hypothetical protein